MVTDEMTVLVEQDQHSFASLKMLREASDWLTVTLSSKAYQTEGSDSEKVNRYVFTGLITIVEPVSNDTSVTFTRYGEPQLDVVEI